MQRFKEHQRHAYAESSRLVVALVAAIVGTILLSSLAVTYLFAVFMYIEEVPPEEHMTFLTGMFGAGCVVVTIIVASGTLYKLFQLRAGGAVIAKDLGGRLIEPDRDTEERKLMNIVEEMSIASGIPVPAVYILDRDRSINAFAAGYDERDAVLGVTRGAIHHLTRDELQGVIAHEYSHILNGDMRLNLRMIGWLHGVIAITIVAQVLIETGQDWNRTSHRNEGNGMLLIVLGAVLWPVGLIGSLIAMIVKSAMSRQREYLADAFAVQFTRHPDALANAFKRLIGLTDGSRVRSARALEASHLFLANGCGNLMAGWLDSHPPLATRILRLAPDWDGVPLFAEVDVEEFQSGAFDGAMSLAGTAALATSTSRSKVADLDTAGRTSASDSSEREQVAELEDCAYRRSIVASVPDDILKINEVEGGPCLVLSGLWLAHASDRQTMKLLPEKRQEQISMFLPVLEQLDAAQQLVLLEEALRELTHQGPDSRGLRAEAQQVFEAFEKQAEPGNLFQWMWGELVGFELARKDLPPSRFGGVEQVRSACEVLLSAVCHVANEGPMAGFAFQRALANLGLEDVRFLDEEELEWSTFLSAVELTAQVAPVPRRKMLRASLAAIATDGEVNAEEVYLIRALCLRMGYGPSSLQVGQPVAPGS